MGYRISACLRAPGFVLGDRGGLAAFGRAWAALFAVVVMVGVLGAAERAGAAVQWYHQPTAYSFDMVATGRADSVITVYPGMVFALRPGPSIGSVSFTYRWYRCDPPGPYGISIYFYGGCGTTGAEIPGASGSGSQYSKYHTTDEDVGKFIVARVYATDLYDGDTENRYSNAVGPIQPWNFPSETRPDTTEITTPVLDEVNATVDEVTTEVNEIVNNSCPSGQVGKPPACVNPNPGSCPQGQTGTPPACVPTPGSGQFSNSCQDGDAKVADGFSGSVYVSLRVQQNPENAQETWACYRAWNATGSVDVGGRVDFDQSGGTPGIPDIEPDSSGCSVTPVDLKVGPDETPVLVGVNSTPSEAQACFQVATFEQRVRVPVPGGVGGVPQVNQDDPTVPDPEERQGNPAHPSSTCQNTPGNTRLANLESGSTWIAAYSAPGGPSETRLCVRGQGPASAGGMLTVRSTTGVAPVVEGPVADTAPSSSCASNVLANGSDPAKFSIRVTATNPASLCLSVGSSGQFGAPGQRFTLGTSGSPVVPVAWTPDPGTPG